MPAWVGSGGSDKGILPGTAVGAGGAWKTIVGMWVGAGGSWKSCFSTGDLNDIDAAYEGINEARLWFRSDGTIDQEINNNITQIGQWIHVLSEASGDWTFRWSLNSGDPVSLDSSAEDTDHPLSSDRNVAVTNLQGSDVIETTITITLKYRGVTIDTAVTTLIADQS